MKTQIEALQRIREITSDNGDLQSACHGESQSTDEFEAQLRVIRGIRMSLHAIAVRAIEQEPVNPNAGIVPAYPQGRYTNTTHNPN